MGLGVCCGGSGIGNGIGTWLARFVGVNMVFYMVHRITAAMLYVYRGS